jgi:hypothetical protein
MEWMAGLREHTLRASGRQPAGRIAPDKRTGVYHAKSRPRRRSGAIAAPTLGHGIGPRSRRAMRKTLQGRP